jgi:preprotein translocase subunit SecD
MITAVLFIENACTETNNQLQFELNSYKLEDVWYDKLDNRYLIYVKLKENYREEFSQITAENIGEKLSIIYKGQILLSPVIRDKIESGIIQIGDSSKEDDAKQLVDSLSHPRK